MMAASQPSSMPAGAATAEVKSAKGIKNHDPDNVTNAFVAGEKAYVWAKISHANNTSIKMVWNLDGKDVWTATLPVKSDAWRTHARRTMKAGKWTVTVTAADGTKLGDVSFTAAAAPATAKPDVTVAQAAAAFGAAIGKKDKAALAKLLATDASFTYPDPSGDDTDVQGADAVAAALIDKAANATAVNACPTNCCTFKASNVEACFQAGKASVITMVGAAADEGD
jgi:hypothetical protein